MSSARSSRYNSWNDHDSSSSSSSDDFFDSSEEDDDWNSTGARWNTHIADGVTQNDVLWPPHKHHLKVRFLNGETWERHVVKKVVRKHYHAVPMRIRFDFLSRDSHDASDIRITFTTWSESCIGRIAEEHPMETTMWLNVRPNIRDKEERRLKRRADILHEFGHALGMVHEHQHPECKANWNYRVLQARTGWSAQKVYRNYAAVSSLYARLTPYDAKSIMHYPIMPGDTQSMITSVSLNTVLSSGDKKFLMALYPIKHTSKPRTERKPAKKSAKKPARKPEQRIKESDCFNPTVVNGSGNAVVKGGYVVIQGSGDVVVNGGGYVELHGSGDVEVFGDSEVKVIGSGDILVHGDGHAVVIGSGDVVFTGRGGGTVLGSGSIKSKKR